MKIKALKNLLKIGNWKLEITLLALLIFVFMPKAVDAALIIQAPKYIGLTNGLVGYWSFDGKDMAGVTAYDRSGNANNGTLTGGPTRAIGKIGQGLSFDGSNDSVAIGTPAIFNIPGAVSLCIWGKWRAMTDSFVFGEYNTGSDVVQYAIVIRSTGAIEFQWANDSSEIYRTATGVISLNNWYHVCGVRISDSNAKMYINGVEQSVTPTGDVAIPSALTSGIHIGREQNAIFDDARVYNRALSGEEIKRLYNLGR